MRIGFDASKIMPPRDGIGTYVAELLRALVAAAPEHEFRLYGTLHPIRDEAVAAILPGPPANVSLASQPAPESGEVDLFHATTWSCPPRFEGPLVFTCYDLTVLSHPQTHALANKIHCLTGLLEARLAGALFLTLSRHAAGELERRLEVPPARIRVTPPGVAQRFRPVPPAEGAAVVERLGLDRPYVLAVGTREPRKNLGRLLEAWQRLPRPLRDRHLLALAGGRGWLHDDVERRLQQGTGIRLLGRVADADLPALYSGAAAFVYPSLAEGFGFPVLEAMACGAPVIASAVSSLPEVAGDAALAVDPTDVADVAGAIRRLLAEPDLARRLRDAGSERAAAFSWQRAAGATLAAYRAAAAEGER
ncbi:MAG: glycosyltransferase family 1 protein [Acidobacteria bacterium]|nr:MAG: glycosyltransferase family 1 protein [Acidobacteriota bacterium]